MITRKMMEESYAKNYGVCGGVKEDYFGLLYLEHEHDVPESRALNQVAFGGNDYGIDGFHFDKTTGNLYLFQFKYSNSHTQFKASMRRLIEAGMELVFSAPNKDQGKNNVLVQLRGCLQENRAAINQIYLRFVFTGDPEEAEKSQVLQYLREDLEEKKHYIDSFFKGRDVQFVVDFRSATGKVGAISVPVNKVEFNISMKDFVVVPGPSGERLHVGMVKLLDLERIYQQLQIRFLDRNIRASYGVEGAVNRAILNALKAISIDQTDPPELFSFNHNGITLYAEMVEPVGGDVKITSPKLLNGAQTVTTTTEFLRKNKDNQRLESGRELLERISVLCKIVTNATPEFITNVTINNNRQNPVAPWNLRANDRIQLELADKFITELEMFYERQENSFNQLSPEHMEEMGLAEESKAITLRGLANLFLLTDGKISRMSDMNRVFEDQKYYDDVFNDKRLSADSRHILLCYKVQFRLRKAIQEIVSVGHNKYTFVPKARHLVWALLCQGLLNSDDLEENLDAFCSDMSIPANFTSTLVDLATKRVRIVLAELLKDKEYKDKIDAGNYSFLRTDRAFDKALLIASKRWGWTHFKLQ